MNFPWLVLGALGTAAIAGAAARITRQYAAAAIAGSALILLLHSSFYFHYTSDDAYISYRYARNLGDGLGLVWNPRQHVEGYSNFLWVEILAGLHYFGADIVLSGRWLGFALAVVAAGGTYLLARQLIDGLPPLRPAERGSGGEVPAASGRVAGLVAALLLASSGTWALWASAGLEPPLFATLILVAVLLHARERDRASAPASGVVWAFVALTRPDGILLFAVSGLFKAGEGVSAARAARGASGAFAREAAEIILWLVGFAIVFAPYFAWRYATYGWLYPNTYYAKVGAGLDQYDRGLRYLASFLEQSGGWLLLLTPAAIAMAPIRHAAAAYIFALLAAWMAYVAYIGGDSLLRFRFFAPVMPLFYALVVATVVALFQALSVGGLPSSPTRGDSPPRHWLPRAAIAFAAAAAIAFTLHPSAADSNLIVGERRAVSDRAEIGRWLRANLPDTTTVAAVPVGAIAYESHLTIIDMLGINDEHIAHRDVALGTFAAGHEKYDSEYVLDRQPDIIILSDGLSASPWTSADYVTLNTVFIPAVLDMLNSPRLAREYERRTVEVREGKWLNVFVRHGAASALAKTSAAPP